MKDWLRFAVAILVPQAAGGIGALFTAPEIGRWYASLTWPAYTPPDWAFGPVWTVLFLLMGIAAFLVWRKGLTDGRVQVALAAFIIQLVLNTLLSFLFFGMHSPALALIEIVLLWIAIAATIFFFYRISRPAAYLLAPYTLWVTFAAYLNYQFWILNY